MNDPTFLTEDEARQKWCRHARIAVYCGPTSAVTVNRHPDPKVEEDCRCKASGCMAWRWAPPTFHPVPMKAVIGEKQHWWSRRPVRWVPDVEPRKREPRKGYCGAERNPT